MKSGQLMKPLKPGRPEKPGHDWRKEFSFLGGSRKFFEGLGVDFDAMLEIMRLKACVMTRTATVNLKRKKGQDGPPPDLGFFSFQRSIASLIMAFFIAMMAFFFEDPTLLLAIAFCAGFVMQFLDALNSLPLVVLDTRDPGVLGTRPVDTRTVGAAKSLLLVMHMTVQTLSCYGLTLVPLIIKGYWNVIPGFLLAIAVSGLLCVALVYLLYGLVLRFFDGEKLKDLVSVLQIVFSIASIVGYQVISRLMAFVDRSAGLDFSWWHALVPPLALTWIGTLFCGLDYLLPALVCLGAVGLLLVLHFGFTSSFLEENLVRMASAGESRSRRPNLGTVWNQLVSRLLFPDKQSRAFYLFSYQTGRGDRRLKQSMYPIMAALLVAPFAGIFSAWQLSKLTFGDYMTANVWPLFYLYLMLFMAPAAVGMVISSQAYAGAWVYGVLPVRSQARACRAVALNMIIKFAAVPTLVIGLALAWFIGPEALPDLGLILAVLFAMSGLFMLLQGFDWPFSKPLGYAPPHPLRNYVLALLPALVPVILHAVARMLWDDWTVWPLLGAATVAAIALWAGIGRVKNPA